MRFAAGKGSTPPSSVSTRRARNPTSTSRSTRASVGRARRNRGRYTSRSSSPEAVADSSAARSSGSGREIPVHFHGHNDFGSRRQAAAPRFVAGARAGAGHDHGMGERAGNANLGEVALTLRALYGVESNLRLVQDSRRFRARPRALGLRARAVEAGHWGDALPPRERRRGEPVSHDPPSIEPYSSELVRAERGVVLGKKSGLDRSGSMPRSWARRARGAACGGAREGQGVGHPQARARPTRSSVSARAVDLDAVVVGSGINSLACAALARPRRLERSGARARGASRRGDPDRRAHTEPGYRTTSSAPGTRSGWAAAAHAELGDELAVRGLEYLNNEYPSRALS